MEFRRPRREFNFFKSFFFTVYSFFFNFLSHPGRILIIKFDRLMRNEIIEDVKNSFTVSFNFLIDVSVVIALSQ